MNRLCRLFSAVFTPPFAGLAAAVVAYVIGAHILYPFNDVLRGNLPDPDDYMYLAQVLDWLHGQNWFDNAQHRLDPPQGTAIHFSRLAQIPIAAGILFFKIFGLGWRAAAWLSSLIEPVFLFALYLAALNRAMTYLIPARWAGASSYVALFEVGLLFEFMPGHVDHHGLVILLILAVMVCLFAMMTTKDGTSLLRNAIAAGLIMALAMTVALESLPWLLLLSALIGLRAVCHGSSAAKAGAVYGFSLLLGSLSGLIATRAPARLFDPDVLSYSVVYVYLAAGICLPFILVWQLAASKPWLRYLCGSAGALASGAIFLHFFPDLLRGPYGAIDPVMRPLLLDYVTEAKPILADGDGVAHMRNLMGMSFLALPCSCFLTWKNRHSAFTPWLIITCMLIGSVAMTIFYQYRFLGMACAVSALPLSAGLYEGWQWISRHCRGRGKVLAEIGLLLLVGPLPAVIIPALFDGRSFNVGMLLFPVDSGHTPCDMSKLEKVLRDPANLGDHPRLIASAINLGPELLFRTNHQVLAAPYHLDVKGNVDAAKFLSTPYPAEAEQIARRRGIDLVLVCRSISGEYFAPPGQPPSLVETLIKGQGPRWLQRVALPGIDNFRLYQVSFQ